MSQATFAPGAGELGGLLGALLPPLLTPLTAHKVRTVRGRWFQGGGWTRMGTDHKCTNIWTRGVQIGNISRFVIYLFVYSVLEDRRENYDFLAFLIYFIYFGRERVNFSGYVTNVTAPRTELLIILIIGRNHRCPCYLEI